MSLDLPASAQQLLASGLGIATGAMVAVQMAPDSAAAWGALAAIGAGIATEFFGGAAESRRADRARQLGSSGSAFRNHDLTRAAGEAIARILRQVAKDHGDRCDRRDFDAIARGATDRLLELAGQPGGLPGVLPDQQLVTLLEYGRAVSEDKPAPRVLNSKMWRALLAQIVRGEPQTDRVRILRPELFDAAAERLAEEFTGEFREVLKQDFGNGGRAFPAAVLTLLADLHAAVLAQPGNGGELAARFSELQEQAVRAFQKAVEKNQESVIAVLRESDQQTLDALGAAKDEILRSIGAVHQRVEQAEKHIKEHVTRELAGFRQEVALRFDAVPVLEEPAGADVRGRTVARHIQRFEDEYTRLFVGREEELAQLDEFASDPVRRVLVVTGLAGVGKSAVLANWVRRRRALEDRVVYHLFSQFLPPGDNGKVDWGNAPASPRRHEAAFLLNVDANGLRRTENACISLLRQVYALQGRPRAALPTGEAALRDQLDHALWDMKEGSSGPRLIFVIDGLDEADSRFDPPFMLPPPPGVSVIVSGRAARGETPGFLQPWVQDAERLHVENLPDGAVARYLRDAEDDLLAEYAADAEFVKQVEARTHRFPLHLRFLVQDLADAAQAGDDPWDVLQETPVGFRAYVDAQLRALRGFTDGERACHLLAALSVAVAPFPEDELCGHLGFGSPLDLRALTEHQQIRRWLRLGREGDAGLLSITSPAIAEAFSRSALRPEVESARTALQRYCAGWREKDRTYAKLYYPFHLRQDGRWDELTELLEDTEFLRAQPAPGYGRWMRYEEAEWQDLVCDWLDHLLRRPDRAASWLSIATVYFNAFCWWAEYVEWTFTERLIDSIRRHAGWEQDPVLSAMVAFHRSYPRRRSWKERPDSDAAAGFAGAGAALRTILHAVSADGEVEAMLSAYRDGNRAERKSLYARLHLRHILNTYLADESAANGELDAHRFHEEGLRILDFKVGDDNVFADDAWLRGYYLAELAEILWGEGDQAGAVACVHDGWQAAVDLIKRPKTDYDPEVFVRLLWVLGRLRAADANAAAEAACYELAFLYTLELQLQPVPADPYTVAVYDHNVERTSRALAALARRTPDDVLECCKNLRRFCPEKDQPDASAARLEDDLSHWLTAGADDRLQHVFPHRPLAAQSEYIERLRSWIGPLRKELKAREARLGLASPSRQSLRLATP